MKQLEFLVLKLKSRLSVDDSERHFAAYRGRVLIIIDRGEGGGWLTTFLSLMVQ